MNITGLKEKLRFYKPTPCEIYIGKNKTAITEVFAAKKPETLALGLQFRSLKENQAMLFFLDKKRKISLHMFFVFSSIDVLFGNWIEKDDEVMFEISQIKENFRPFTLTKGTKQTNGFIELPLKAIKRNKLSKGKVLLFKISSKQRGFQAPKC